MTAQVDATFLRRCLGTLLVLEQSGKLLKKRLTPYFANSRQVDRREIERDYVVFREEGREPRN